MRFEQYHMAPDCPVCGLKDAKDEWSGARMGSSAWGHWFPCCSDKCGFALAEVLKRMKPRQVRALAEKMEDQAGHRLALSGRSVEEIASCRL